MKPLLRVMPKQTADGVRRAGVYRPDSLKVEGYITRLNRRPAKVLECSGRVFGNLVLPSLWHLLFLSTVP